jgi:AcrR family transcriptional regulator
MPGSPTARSILGAARRLLDRGGAEAVTMRRVAKAVGLTPMAIYRHFPDRSALLNALADEGFEELASLLKSRRFGGDLETQLFQMADVYLDHAFNNPRLFELMFLAKREGARRYPQDFKAGRSPTAGPPAELLDEAMRSGKLRKGDFWEIAFEMGAFSHGLIMLYLGGRIDMTQDEFRALYRRAFRRYLRGIRV